MGRLFKEHYLRHTESLDGFWEFTTDKERCGQEKDFYNGFPSQRLIAVPQVWNSEEGLLTYTGQAWYQKRFFFAGGTMRLVFDAVMTQCTVWLDGKELGSHYGGFTAFDFILQNVNKGEHVLVVCVDNDFDEHSIPQRMVDWYHYGGIIRSVHVETLSGICILANRVEYALDGTLANASVNFLLDLYNASGEERSDTVCVEIDDAQARIPVTLSAGERKCVRGGELYLTNIRLWDVLAPQLYTVTARSATDDLIDRMGFRQLEVKGQEILLNGKRIEIRGVNRHEEHPDWGFAFPSGLMKKDLGLILSMGANAIRGSHYPNSKAFLDLVDDCGLLFWSEIPIWGVGFRPEQLADEIIISRGFNMHREMLAQYYNHPSIIIWGMHNEIATGTEYAVPISKLYYNYLKENGGNRAVVYASCAPLADKCFSFCDILCLNQYYGWYRGYEENAWESFLEQFEAHCIEIGEADKPVIMSEFGWAALFGDHDADDILWSEEYQAKQYEKILSLFHAHPRIAGFYIWQFADIRTSREVGLNRARGFNNKGVLNEHRKPKLAYHVIKRLYKAFCDSQ